MTCLDPNQLNDLMQGLLAPDEERAAEAHLDACENCQRVVAAVLDEPQGALDEPATAPQALPPGTMVGEAVVVGPCDLPGFGVAWLACAPRRGLACVVKLLGSSGSESERLRLFAAAQAAAALRHPALAAVIEVGATADGAFLTFERPPAVGLGEWLGQARPGWRRVCRLFLAVAGAVAEAHARGLALGLTPDRIAVRHDGRPFVAAIPSVDSTLAQDRRVLSSCLWDALPAEARRPRRLRRALPHALGGASPGAGTLAHSLEDALGPAWLRGLAPWR